MAVSGKIAPASAPSVAPATNRVGGVRGGAGGADRVEELSYSLWLGTADASPRFDEQPQDSGEWSGQQRRPRENLWALTPLLTRFTGNFVVEAGEAPENGADFGTALARTEIRRGVGVYEHNMQVTSGDTRQPGSLLNHFY